MYNRTKNAAIEEMVKTAKEAIELRDKVERLFDNPDFKAVIQEGYFEKEAARLVALKASPSSNNEASQKALENKITGIGQLQQYLLSIYVNAENSERTLEEYTQMEDSFNEDGE